MTGPLVRAHVDDFREYLSGWQMELSGTGPLPDAVIKAIAGGRVLVTFERGSGGTVVEAETSVLGRGVPLKVLLP